MGFSVPGSVKSLSAWRPVAMTHSAAEDLGFGGPDVGVSKLECAGECLGLRVGA